MDGKGRAKSGLNRRQIRKKEETHGTSINALKKRRRDLKRLLEHSEKLPADVRVGHERELASCDQEIGIAESEARRSQMVKKYHMVRFFERQKATRALRKAKQKLVKAETPAEKKNCEAEAHKCEVDLNYTLYYPLDIPYVSLYAAQSSQSESVSKNNPMWKVVESEMVNQRLQDLRQGKLELPANLDKKSASTIPGNSTSSQRSLKRAKQGSPLQRTSSQSKRRKNLPHHDEELGSDREDGAGFFE